MSVVTRQQSSEDVRRAICEARYGPRRQIADAFQQIWYATTHTWGMTYWQGVPVLKSPLDLWVYQEMIVAYKPALIIETGTAFGGSALFYAHTMDLAGIDGQILTIDTEPRTDPKVSAHPRIVNVVSDSLDPSTIAAAKRFTAEANGRHVMVILDSDHSQSHVRKELDAYCGFVSEGCYLVVEDTNVNGNPVHPGHGPGPYEAVVDFLDTHLEFHADPFCNKYLGTMHPGGWLRKES